MAHERTLDEIQKAIRAHGMWKLRLKTAISSGSSDATPEVVGCDHLCEFGKWLYDDTMPTEILNGKPYQVVKRLHAEFHQTAGEVLKNALDGNASKSKELLDGGFAEKSDKLVRALTLWKTELRNS
ncbi:CZB domain-containing protein [Phaeobacter italicus]|uniref:CZB domain-containing protein n=1 Tax=Phaeobacter italicus TaxID=481446 RepID=UPI000669D0E7|nr:CZB domain-containing protein [Phaeobacter italicus]CRL15230.1 diguanylate cyclase [Phaeobacter italicus]SFH68446.1 Chemoreceptor zinc-binding domain-containing protein [Phaeobacter italicus]